jgi:hypothetical protein
LGKELKMDNKLFEKTIIGLDKFIKKCEERVNAQDYEFTVMPEELREEKGVVGYIWGLYHVKGILKDVLLKKTQKGIKS